jgi:hypothetical protein
LEHFIKTQISLGDVSDKFGQRHINQTQEELLTNRLKQFRGTINVGLYSGSQEAKSFQNEILRIFKNAGWKVNGEMQGIMARSGAASEDLWVYVNLKDSISVYSAEIFYNAMTFGGYKMQVFTHPFVSTGKGSIKSNLEIGVFTYTGRKE